MRLHCLRIATGSVLTLCCLVQLGASTPAAGAQAARGRLDACSLVTKAEVEAVAGRSVPEPTKAQAGSQASCSYLDPQARMMIAVVEVFAGNDAAQGREIFKQRSQSAAQVQAVSGLGDDARWNAISKTLTVLKEKYVLSLVTPQGLDAARKLAANALTRLP